MVEQTAVPRIGLTGGIASGKSTVADMFAELGAPVIDTDVIAREVVAAGQPALGEIAKAFGDEILLASGELDRAAMRRRVFADEQERRRLEGILHPRIREETMRRAGAAGGPYQIIVVPLLAESPLRHAMDRVLVVDVPPAVQLERLMRRDGETRAQAERIVRAQAGRGERLAIADDVLSNAGEIDTTRRRVAELDRAYRRLADTPASRGRAGD